MHIVAVCVGAALMFTGIGHVIASNLQLLELQAEVNNRLPQPQKFEPVFWTFGRWTQLRHLQQKLLPQSPRPKKARRFAAIGFSVFFAGVWLLCVGLKGFYA